MLWHTGNTASFYITQPSINDYIQIVSTTMTTASVTCSLNITIPLTMIVLWTHNNTNVGDGVSQTGKNTTLLISNFQPSGDYQCVFIDGGWTIRRNIRLFINGMFISYGHTYIHVTMDNNSVVIIISVDVWLELAIV